MTVRNTKRINRTYKSSNREFACFDITLVRK